MQSKFLIMIAASSILLIPFGYFLWTEYVMMCNNAVTEHLRKYSNLFDENTIHETFGINDIGFPFGVHSWNIQECVDHTLKKRISKSESISQELATMKPTDRQLVSDPILFRIFSFHEDDYGKPIIRIEEQYMEKLEVSSGDTVKITGNREVSCNSSSTRIFLQKII